MQIVLQSCTNFLISCICPGNISEILLQGKVIQHYIALCYNALYLYFIFASDSIPRLTSITAHPYPNITSPGCERCAAGEKSCTMINAWNGLSSGRNGVVGGNHENFLKNRQKVLVNKIFFVHLQTQTKPGSLGSLAQLVQSVCLTSRGSGVRLPQLPQREAVTEM